MGTDEFKGLHKVRKPLADGGISERYYAWRGGPRIMEAFGTPAFAEAFRRLHLERARQQAKPAEQPTLGDLIDRYRASGSFTRKLSPRSQRDYGAILDKLKSKFGSMSTKVVEQRGARAFFLEWRDARARESVRRADYEMSILAIVMSWAVDRELLLRNPCARAGKLYVSDRKDKIWSEEQEAALLKIAPPHLALPFMIALYTGQRQGDILALTWEQYDGVHIRLEQGKTGARVAVRVADKLKAILDALPRTTAHICVTSRGKPWDDGGFRASWSKLSDKAGVHDRTFHDLRGTAVSRFFALGVGQADIAAITGHALNDVRSILDATYFHRAETQGDRAIEALNQRDRQREDVRLQAGLQA